MGSKHKPVVYFYDEEVRVVFLFCMHVSYKIYVMLMIWWCR